MTATTALRTPTRKGLLEALQASIRAHPEFRQQVKTTREVSLLPRAAYYHLLALADEKGWSYKEGPQPWRENLSIRDFLDMFIVCG